MSRSIAASVSPTSTPTPWATLGPELPGMRSRRAPNARAEPVPIECTPDTSRQALPAIFWTTPSATEICPSPVARRSLVAGLAWVLVVTGVVSLVLDDVGSLIWQAPLFYGEVWLGGLPGRRYPACSSQYQSQHSGKRRTPPAVTAETGGRRQPTFPLALQTGPGPAPALAWSGWTGG